MTRSHVASHHVRISHTSGSGSYFHHSYRSGVLGAWLIAEKRSDVRTIQRKLGGKGYGLAVDGQYGPLTTGAVNTTAALTVGLLGRRSGSVGLVPGDGVASATS